MPVKYCVNGWDEHTDRDGSRYYTCPHCGVLEGGTHDADCPRYIDWGDDDEDEESTDA